MSLYLNLVHTHFCSRICVCVASNTSTVCVPFMIAPFAPRLAYSLFSRVTIKRKMKTKKEQKKHRPPSSSYGRMLNINLKWSNLCASIVSFVHSNVDGTGHTESNGALCLGGPKCLMPTHTHTARIYLSFCVCIVVTYIIALYIEMLCRVRQWMNFTTPLHLKIECAPMMIVSLFLCSLFMCLVGYLDFICSRFISILCYLDLGWLI